MADADKPPEPHSTDIVRSVVPEVSGWLKILVRHPILTGLLTIAALTAFGIWVWKVKSVSEKSPSTSVSAKSGAGPGSQAVAIDGNNPVGNGGNGNQTVSQTVNAYPPSGPESDTKPKFYRTVPPSRETSDRQQKLEGDILDAIFGKPDLDPVYEAILCKLTKRALFSPPTSPTNPCHRIKGYLQGRTTSSLQSLKRRLDLEVSDLATADDCEQLLYDVACGLDDALDSENLTPATERSGSPAQGSATLTAVKFLLKKASTLEKHEKTLLPSRLRVLLHDLGTRAQGISPDTEILSLIKTFADSRNSGGIYQKIEVAWNPSDKKLTTHVLAGSLNGKTDIISAADTYSYDYKGNRTSNGESLVYKYDCLGRIESVTSPSGYTVSYTYDVYGRLKSFGKNTGESSEYEYNNLDQLIRSTDPLGNTTLYTYDSLGRIESVTANCINKHFSYDERGDLIRSVATTPEGIYNTDFTFAYDSTGQLNCVDALPSSKINPTTYSLFERCFATSHKYNDLAEKERQLRAQLNAYVILAAGSDYDLAPLGYTENDVLKAKAAVESVGGETALPPGKLRTKSDFINWIVSLRETLPQKHPVFFFSGHSYVDQKGMTWLVLNGSETVNVADIRAAFGGSLDIVVDGCSIESVSNSPVKTIDITSIFDGKNWLCRADGTAYESSILRGGILTEVFAQTLVSKHERTLLPALGSVMEHDQAILPCQQNGTKLFQSGRKLEMACYGIPSGQEVWRNRCFEHSRED